MCDKKITNVKYIEIKKFVIEVLLKYKLTFEDAEIVSEHLITANLRGVDTHGVIRLKAYIDRTRNGGNNPTPEIKVVENKDISAVMDGDNSFGQVGGYRAMELAIEKAERYGAGMVTMRNSNHYGAAGYYAMMPLKHDMIGISMTNVLACMAPTGGTEPRIGNNPMSVAIPALKKSPVVLDFATSKSSWGRALISKLTRVALPDGCFLDSEGNSTTDPDSFFNNGTLLPMAEYKGYGMALIISIFCTLLSGGKFDMLIPNLYDKLNEPGENSFFMAALKIENFASPIDFKRRLDEIITTIKNTPFAKNIDKIYLPGEKEFEEEKKRKEIGIPLKKELLNDLVKIAQEAKVDIKQYDFLKN